VADANGKAPKSGAKALEFWKASFENEVLTRTSLELLLAEKASSVFAAEAGAANAQQQVTMLEASMAELRKQLSKAQDEQARLADGFVANTSNAAESLEQLKRERDNTDKSGCEQCKRMRIAIATATVEAIQDRIRKRKRRRCQNRQRNDE
jgi:hypothetical protein